MKKKVKALLICNSNMFIPTVLSEVLSNPNEQYLVISDTENITRFFHFVAIPNVDYYEYSSRGKLHVFTDKRNLIREIARYEIDKLVFFHAEFGGMANWLIKTLSKSISIEYCKLYDSIPAPHSRKMLSVIKMKVMGYFYWGVNMDILQYATSLIPSLPNSFFSDIKAKKVLMTINKELVGQTVLSRLNNFHLSGRYVLLTGTVVHDGYYSKEDYTNFVNLLISAIGVDNVISKCHPRYTELYGLEQQLPQIPSFIPGNVFIDNYEYYIGFESTLLVEAAVAGKKAISLIDWFSPSNNAAKQIHAFFDSRLHDKGIIYYPKSLNELRTLLTE